MERLSKPNRHQIIRLAMVLVGIWLLVNFAFGVWEYLPVRAEESRWRAALAREEERHEALTQRLEYVVTDAYVEREARERFRMIKPGEHLVRPIWIGQNDRPDGGRLAVAEVVPTWQLWWDRFFGSSGSQYGGETVR